MSIELHFPNRLHACVQLPYSKSLSNRALLIRALSGMKSPIRHLALCNDTRAVLDALKSEDYLVDIGAAGTAMRFLTAYFATQLNCQRVLTGCERMKQRPIGILVDALRSLGADIRYKEREGFPPLAICGHPLEGGTLELPANVSSQFISALLLIAPTLSKGMTLHLKGPIVSRPYIDMTLALMRHFGAEATWCSNANSITVNPVPYNPNVEYTVEPDWSAAAYWLEMAAIAPIGTPTHITLPGLQANSIQGDREATRLFAPLGVETSFDTEKNEALITRNEQLALNPRQTFTADLSGQPDVVQSLVVACVMQQRPFRFTGVDTLRIKETDRIEALRCELIKFGVPLQVEGNHTIFIKEYSTCQPHFPKSAIATYNDHRMAMSFAPAAWRFPGLIIENPDVVNKSYTTFWNDIKNL